LRSSSAMLDGACFDGKQLSRRELLSMALPRHIHIQDSNPIDSVHPAGPRVRRQRLGPDPQNMRIPKMRRTAMRLTSFWVPLQREAVTAYVRLISRKQHQIMHQRRASDAKYATLFQKHCPKSFSSTIATATYLRRFTPALLRPEPELHPCLAAQNGAFSMSR
jgi:hypothetical protein